MASCLTRFIHGRTGRFLECPPPFRFKMQRLHRMNRSDNPAYMFRQPDKGTGGYTRPPPLVRLRERPLIFVQSAGHPPDATVGQPCMYVSTTRLRTGGYTTSSLVRLRERPFIFDQNAGHPPDATVEQPRMYVSATNAETIPAPMVSGGTYATLLAGIT